LLEAGLPNGESAGTGDDPKLPNPELPKPDPPNPVDGCPNADVDVDVDVDVGWPNVDFSVALPVPGLCPNFGVNVEAAGFSGEPKIEELADCGRS
jgi:hypothetical protein